MIMAMVVTTAMTVPTWCLTALARLQEGSDPMAAAAYALAEADAKHRQHQEIHTVRLLGPTLRHTLYTLDLEPCERVMALQSVTLAVVDAQGATQGPETPYILAGTAKVSTNEPRCRTSFPAPACPFAPSKHPRTAHANLHATTTHCLCSAHAPCTHGQLLPRAPLGSLPLPPSLPLLAPPRWWARISRFMAVCCSWRCAAAPRPPTRMSCWAWCGRRVLSSCKSSKVPHWAPSPAC